jgi:hypothetical protein
MMRCPVCDTPNPPENQRCQHCGENLPPPSPLPAPEDVLDVVPVSTAAPPDSRVQMEDGGTDVVLTLIPYKNPKALAAYYCGFFALIPVLGFVLGVVAMVLGIQGLQYSSANPGAKGAAHAITGIILGAVAFFCWNPVICLLFWFSYWYLP